MGKKYIIRPVTINDSQRIWEIRNLPFVRENSGNSKRIPFAKHNIWFFKKYFKESGNHCFVLESQDKVIGYCRFDFNTSSDGYVISIALDTDYTGKGFGQKLLHYSLQQIKNKKAIVAEVKKDNIPSIKLFEKNNFKTLTENKNNYFYKYNP